MITESMAEPVCAVLPVVAGNDTAPAPTSPGTAATAALPFTSSPSAVGATTTQPAGTSSLPFTGADIGELAVVGVGAVLAGGLLIRRRRSLS